MKITWITRSFLDYRVPVYKALDELCDHNLTLIYYGDVVPERVQNKLKTFMGKRAIALSGEWRIGGRKADNATMANKGFRIPIQPGLIKAIRQTDPDIMISDGFFQWTYAPLLVRMRHPKIKHVMCYERTKHTERNAGMIRTLYRKLALNWIDAVDCNGSLTGEYMESLGYPKDKLTFGHMVADTTGLLAATSKVTDTQIESLKKKLGIDKESVFLYVGQIIPRKGIKEMVAAWQKKAFANAKLVLVGTGEQRAEIEAMIANGKSGSIVLAGSVDYDHIAPYYKMADCFIIPTLEDNWSLVVPEAMACGLPIVCSKYNGCHPELVTPQNGWVFDPLDQESFVKVLGQVYAAKDRLAEMGRQSQSIVSRHTPLIAAKGIWEACLMTQEKSKQHK